MVTAVNTVKESIEEKKFVNGEDEESVQEWTSGVEEIVNQADECMRELTRQIEQIDRNLKHATALHEHKREIELEREKLRQKQEAVERAHAEELEFEKKKLELKQVQTEPPEITAMASNVVKMPKLVITKFDGTPQDWVRFWGQFETQIDKSSTPEVTKFSYLKELVDLKVRNLIDGLPFTPEGYKKAKDLLARRYGKTSEVVGTYVRNILELPTVRERDVKRIHEFYEKLLFNVESLQTLQSINKLDAAVRFTFDKLDVIKNELAMIDENWSEWTFVQFLEALEKWTINNPVQGVESSKTKAVATPVNRREKSRAFYAKRDDRNQQANVRRCLFCQSPDHKAVNCDKVVSIEARKKVFLDKRMCFNCSGIGHRAGECKSKSTCQVCHARHNTSLCDNTQSQVQTREPGMTANHIGNSAVIHPVVVVKINGYKFRALLDSGASHSYASATAIDLIDASLKSTGLRQIAMLTGVTTRTMQVFGVVISSVASDFELEVDVTKVNKKELLILENPRYNQLIEGSSHLKGVRMDDVDEKAKLPVHLILGANEFAKIRTGERLRVGRRGDPVAEYTRFGWTIMSPGADQDLSPVYLAVNSNSDFERLCSLDVLGLADTPAGDQFDVYDEFKEQLTRSPEGWYETSLPWKGNCPALPNNRDGSMRRLNSLLRKLSRKNMLDDYDDVIREQLAEGVVERAPAEVSGREFYLPHRAVVREGAETTKLRVVYDASARDHEAAPSLNECLHAGPPLQNKLWSVLTRCRFHPVLVAGDLRRAFLQVRIREGDRDALRFHWIVDKTAKEVETLRFTRVVFGLAPSPFLLNGVIQQHLQNLETKFPETVNEVRKSLYVDDLISGGSTADKAKQLKREAVEIFNDAKFELHKWHSNKEELETDCENYEGSFAKEQLNNVLKPEGIKLLGVGWDKVQDTLYVDFPSPPAELTKRGILANLAKVYDPLGLASPVLLEGKLLYRETCVQKSAWDSPLPEDLAVQWKKWEQNIPDAVTVQRCVPLYEEEIHEIQLHAFGDASGRGVCAAVYAVVTQTSGTSQGLITAKARLAKQGLTIPRLELVSGHMAANLANNVRQALEGLPLAVNIHCWLDSSVALHWISDHGDYRQFVANRVRKIQSHRNVLWHHVPTVDNPADLGSRGGSVSGAEIWWKGPAWLGDPAQWPPEIVTEPSPDSRAERKVQRELFAVGVEGRNEFDDLLEKFGLRKIMRIGAWISRFLRNCRCPSNKLHGPLTTAELAEHELFWIKRAQIEGMSNTNFIVDQEQLNLQPNKYGVLECRGRLQGDYPIYLPDSVLFTAKVVQHAHVTTLHGGVSLTMTKVREKFWVPRLRKLVKKTVKNCNGCKRFQVVAMKNPPTAPLPSERTEGTTPFNVIGVDFAGPVKYRSKRKDERKAYVVLYSCSLTRGVFLELLSSLETTDFIQSLKRFIAGRGRLSKVYSDNGKTFVAAAKWLKRARADERFNSFLSEHDIQWQFNLSRAPWWGGQFERLIGLMKSMFYKTVGQGLLTWEELSEVILDIEVAMNNRPLCYVEEDVQLPTLTPNVFLMLNSSVLPELQPYHIEERDLRKRAKFLMKTKDAMWRRWTTEYLSALRERHRLRRGKKGKENSLAVGDVVIVKSQERNRSF